MKNVDFQANDISTNNSIYQTNSISNWTSNQILNLNVFFNIKEYKFEKISSLLFINSNTILSQNFTFFSFLYEENCILYVEYVFTKDVNQSSTVNILINNNIFTQLLPNKTDFDQIKTVNQRFNMTQLENKLEIKGSSNMRDNTFYLKKVEMRCEV